MGGKLKSGGAQRTAPREAAGAVPGGTASPGEALWVSGPGRKKGLVKVMYRMHPRQAAALRAEAFRRAEKRPVGRPDASEVLREIVEAWLEKRER
jgi:hypothetical protein